MNNEDMSEMIQKLSSMMSQSNSENTSNINSNDMSSNSGEINFENLQNILSNMNFNSETNDNMNQDDNSSNNNNFNFDFDMMMKMKRVMDSVQSSKNSPEANLLLSLKPYLNSNRKQKLDQYMQFLNMAKIFEAFNSNGGVNNK